VAFVGISNWKLDASKMNRVVKVARPDLSEEGLVLLGKALLDTYEVKTTNLKNICVEYITQLAKTYVEFS
jgi:fibronectin type 3 domain-containing protein